MYNFMIVLILYIVYELFRPVRILARPVGVKWMYAAKIDKEYHLHKLHGVLAFPSEGACALYLWGSSPRPP